MSVWQKRGPQELDLPSGQKVRVLPGPSIKRLMTTGRIPNPLLAAVARIEEKAAGSPDEINGDDLTDVTRYQAAVVCATLIEPHVSAEPTDDPDTLDFFDLPEDDVTFLFAYAVGGIEALEPFREEPAKPARARKSR